MQYAVYVLGTIKSENERVKECKSVDIIIEFLPCTFKSGNLVANMNCSIIYNSNLNGLI